MAEYDFDRKMAFVTGGARGQGRSHALRYAENGANVVCADVCGATDESTYDLGDETELNETVREVEERIRPSVRRDVASPKILSEIHATCA